eukprot:TRINITY_DN72324_c0_g1_i1.p1 TRINITY_DN72324_c0_g1~~TRINITY_DN72324_c0_g1_i1.p1  ORF type:complete len:635 (+),score=94.76 TRINITY_DN72324_c0_g1_i1:45-1907(+)
MSISIGKTRSDRSGAASNIVSKLAERRSLASRETCRESPRPEEEATPVISKDGSLIMSCLQDEWLRSFSQLQAKLQDGVREEIRNTVHSMGEKLEDRMDELSLRLRAAMLDPLPQREFASSLSSDFHKVDDRGTIHVEECSEIKTPVHEQECDEFTTPRSADDGGISLNVRKSAPLDVVADNGGLPDLDCNALARPGLASGNRRGLGPRSLSKGSLASKGSVTSSNYSHGSRNKMQNLAIRKRRQGSLTSQSSYGGNYFDAMKRTRNRPDWQKTVWQFLEDPDLVRGGRTFMNVISALILMSVLMPLLQTIEGGIVSNVTEVVIEVCLDCVFVLETAVRLFCCPNRFRFLFSVYNIIDLVAAFLPLALHASAMDMRIGQTTQQAEILILLTAIPILRLMKLLRRFETFHLLTKALADALEALPMLIFTLGVIVLVFASCIYVLEPRWNIRTMGEALWFSIVTVGTIGYGDTVPKSVGGLVVSSILIVVSALYMAIPLGIVGEAFSRVWKDRDRLLLVHRTQIRFLNTGYRAEDIPPMFCGWDNDGDGMVTLPEFMNMMKQMELDMPNSRMVDLFQTFDRDGNGTIDDQEFVRTLFPEAYAELYSAIEGTADNKPLGGEAR